MPTSLRCDADDESGGLCGVGEWSGAGEEISAPLRDGTRVLWDNPGPAERAGTIASEQDGLAMRREQQQAVSTQRSRISKESTRQVRLMMLASSWQAGFAQTEVPKLQR